MVAVLPGARPIWSSGPAAAAGQCPAAGAPLRHQRHSGCRNRCHPKKWTTMPSLRRLHDLRRAPSGRSPVLPLRRQHPPHRARSFRSQPLAPPPGAAVAPSGPPHRLPYRLPVNIRSHRAPGSLHPADGNRTKPCTEMPSQKIANPMAVFAGLDKITGRIIAFEVKIDEKVQFGALQVTPRVCCTRPPTGNRQYRFSSLRSTESHSFRARSSGGCSPAGCSRRARHQCRRASDL